MTYHDSDEMAKQEATKTSDAEDLRTMAGKVVALAVLVREQTRVVREAVLGGWIEPNPECGEDVEKPLGLISQMRSEFSSILAALSEAEDNLGKLREELS